MRELGYPRTQAEPSQPPGIWADQHVVVAQKRCGIADVQRAFAEAVVENKPLMMFSTDGYTRDASRWADRANVALFDIWNHEYQVSAASSLGREHLPQTM